MKKILLLVFLFSSFYCYSQTKSETINWIIKKISEYGNTNNQTINSANSSGVITFSYIDNLLKTKNTCTFNLNDVISAQPAPWFSGEKPSGFKINITTKKNKAKYTSATDEHLSNGTTLILDYDEDLDKDLYHRFYKAMDKLISYNKAETQNEPF